MASYKGNTCPVCHIPFAEGDDVVVCPDCGTPYHRACWAKAGGCVNAAQHGTGFEWKPDFTPDGLPNELVCPNCGTHNPATAQVCTHCGIPLSGEMPASPPSAGPIYNRAPGSRQPGGQQAPGAQSGGQAPHATQSFNGFSLNGAVDFDPFRKEIGPDDMIDGIKARDWASFIGPSSIYYLLQFLRLDETKRKIGVSFSAFFFGPFYFFYRKMWKEGIVFTLISLALSLPSLLAVLAVSGSGLVAGMATGWISSASVACTVLDCLQMILRSAFAGYWYKKESGKRIRAVYDSIPDPQSRADALAMRGGTSVLALALCVGGYLLFSMGFYALMGPNVQAVYQMMFM